MNKHFYRSIACSAFLFFPLAQVHAQDSPAPAEQQRQEMVQTHMSKSMAAKAASSRTNAPISERDSEYMFRFKMRKMMMEKMRRSGGTGWEPTEWQKTLPAIVVQDGGATREYSFSDLINADGYLCLGSARAYKALKVALPLLYGSTTPIKGDFKITHGASICTSLVYDFFMQDYTAKEFLELDTTIKEKLISIQRLSTGKKVTIIFDPSEIRGHDKAAAQAGDLILRAQEGDGMTLYVEEE